MSVLTAIAVLSSCYAEPEVIFDKLSIVTTIFPEYDWVRQLLGETSNADLTLLLGNGVDLHSYQPSIHDGLVLHGIYYGPSYVNCKPITPQNCKMSSQCRRWYEWL